MAQQRGVPLGYHFKWCLKGPYCQELTEDVAAVLGYTPEKNWVITESINDKLDDINQFLLHLKAEVLKGSFVENIIDVSIIQFILATGQAGKDSKAILKVLRKGKVCISEDRVQEVLRTLEIFSFFN